MLQRGMSPTVQTYHAFFQILRSGDEVFELLEKMNKVDCCPNNDTYAMLIRKFCLWHQLDNVFKLWGEMSKNGDPDRSSYVRLIDTCSCLAEFGCMETLWCCQVDMKNFQVIEEVVSLIKCNSAVQFRLGSAVSSHAWVLQAGHSVTCMSHIASSFCIAMEMGSRGCLGCCTKPPLIIAVDEPSKGLRIRGQAVKKPGISEDFWSTSTCEMENSAVQSQRSVSSMSTSNPPLDPYGNVGSTSLLLWNQTRQQWTGNKKPQTSTQVREPILSSNATYESLLGTNKAFPQPIPLPEMVDFLVDVWEQEGLYD
ncbi:hypothetical protein RHMOL_Rhmol02G0250700 [Rhododendron molle]|uniref:Uncharacterized protein n=1 Tax=Rhododendron molle TaxID=49168 RepID=A0ACC0PU14_RHOML|nr:hypothetical protein RHMOL_Rhmol02G0250700 [Rhododendron molle]